ncbi:MAG: topoisomerase C-terminal repeat-containing protein, partial [Burkholderiales bacterium]
PFSAYLVKQADGKVGFEFEAKAPGRSGARPVRSAPLRVLGTHPRDRPPVELHAGRYGPYVKHGATNATLPDRDAVDSLSLEQAVALVDEKAGRGTAGARRRTVKTRAPRKARAAAAESDDAVKMTQRASRVRSVRAPAAKTKPATRKTTAKTSPVVAKRVTRDAKSAGARKTRATSKAPTPPVSARKPVARAAARKTRRR